MNNLCKSLILILLSQQIIAYGTKCTQYFDDALFSLSELSSVVDYKIINIQDLNEYQVSFNFCQFTKTMCNKQDAYANIFDKNQKINCHHLTNNQEFNDINASLIDNDVTKGIILDYKNGDLANSETNSTFKFRVIINCDQTADVYKINYAFYVQQTNTVVVQSCPIADLGKISELIKENKYIFVPMICIIGLIFAFFGKKLINYTLFAAGMAFGTGIFMFLSTEFIILKESSNQTIWICIAVSLLIGVFTGYFFIKITKLGMFAVGCWLGYIISLILYSTFIYKIESNPVELILYLSNAIISLIFGLLALFLFDQILIISTAFCGSFFAIFSLSQIFGNFPNIYAISKYIKLKQYDNIQGEVYIYFPIIIILAFISGYFQFKQQRINQNNGKNEQTNEYQLIDRV